MADRKTGTSGRPAARRKEKKEVVEVKKEPRKEGKAPAAVEKTPVNAPAPPEANGEAANGMAAPAADGGAANGTAAPAANGEVQVEPMELPPFEIITGDRIDPFFFKFQFKNVEYSSGRNKTFLCYLVDQGSAAEGLLRGFLEDEHAGAHSEQAFFLQTLPSYDPALKYTVTWYVSSSPCATCAAKLVEVLQARKSLKLTIFSARLFEWEEPDIQAGLRALAQAGCKLRMMKPLDFSRNWLTSCSDHSMLLVQSSPSQLRHVDISQTTAEQSLVERADVCVGVCVWLREHC
ncbi:C-_U-editing enzyme APOBEC-2a isoform X2 [Hypomesus transpacificus]|uniref:C->U-editing enzyme APOBEC-2a isoform X2 n=1 Tax=Hypomesus transpacificus TaxID=137520 RepID=UPI001F073ABD|nr:C->U-editing enzyme APOBEC-2a isoform X2 [Hypomesus transpacificus]